MLYSRTDYEINDPADPINRRSLLLHGLGLTLRRLPVVLWAFAFNLFYAAFAAIGLALSVESITGHSLATQPLRHGFDLGTLISLFLKLHENKGFDPNFRSSILLYLLVYFFLVPGALYCYQTDHHARLSTLLRAGASHFWRFVRILILSLIVAALILGPLALGYSKYSDYLDDHILGRTGFLCRMAGILVLALVAALLRLYFDLVEAYTVQIGLQERPNGNPDRRVRRAILPAFRTLRRNFFRAYFSFILLAALGIVAVAFATRFGLHSLAKTHVWPIFLVTQASLFLMLFTRFWQRGAETVLTLDYPILEEEIISSTRTTRASFIPVYEPLPPAPTPPPPAAIEPVTPEPVVIEEPPLAALEPAIDPPVVEEPPPPTKPDPAHPEGAD